MITFCQCFLEITPSFKCHFRRVANFNAFMMLTIVSFVNEMCYNSLSHIAFGGRALC
jgi:hypothetical protein